MCSARKAFETESETPVLDVVKSLLLTPSSGGMEQLASLVSLAQIVASTCVDASKHEALSNGLLKTVLQEALRVWKGGNVGTLLQGVGKGAGGALGYFELAVTLMKKAVESYGHSSPAGASGAEDAMVVVGDEGVIPPHAFAMRQAQDELWRLVSAYAIPALEDQAATLEDRLETRAALQWLSTMW